MKFMSIPATVSIPKSKTVKVDSSWFINNIQVREGGKAEGIGFYLNEEYDWTLVVDEDYFFVLIPLKKD